MFFSHECAFAHSLGRTDLAALIAASTDFGPQESGVSWFVIPTRDGRFAAWVLAGYVPEGEARFFGSWEHAVEAFVAGAVREYATVSGEEGATGPVRVTRHRRDGRTVGFTLSREGADPVLCGERPNPIQP